MGSVAKQSRRAVLGTLTSLTLGLATGCGSIPELPAKNAAPLDPKRVVVEYFALITENRYDDAQGLLSPAFQSSLGPSGLAGLLHSIHTARVTEMVDAVEWANSLGARLPAPPADRREYLVTLSIDPSPSGSSTWSVGTNRRFVDLVKRGTSWQIDGIGIMPGVLVTGKPSVESEPQTQQTFLLPTEELRLGPAPIDRIIYTARQNAADRGQASWAIDPLQVLHRDGPSFGIRPTDLVTLLGQDVDPVTLIPRLSVVVLHDDRLLRVRLIQPIRAGAGGVWVIADIAVVPPFPD